MQMHQEPMHQQIQFMTTTMLTMLQNPGEMTTPGIPLMDSDQRARNFEKGKHHESDEECNNTDT